ncbi:MAG: O-antigen ligase family protein [Bryobacteraceae bacterium]
MKSLALPLTQPAPEKSFLAQAAFYLAWASAVSILFSIAVSQILITLAAAALLLSGIELRLPRIWAPITAFLALTLVSLAFSDDPWAGRPQIRKFFVYGILLVLFSTFRKIRDARWLALSWAAVASAGAILSLVQFAHKLHEARLTNANFYESYVGRRITGFMSHWMTFGGEEMIVLVMLAAFLLFSPRVRSRYLWLGIAGAVLMGVSLLLGMTRSVWFGAAFAIVYLLGCRQRWLAAAAPVALTAILLLAPAFVQTRVGSFFAPTGVDSNEQRVVCWRTGWQMIQAHPWLGLGPEMVGKHFAEYIPAGVTQPPHMAEHSHLHDIYIQYAAERGLPALLAVLWMFGQILWDFSRALRRLPRATLCDERFLLHGAIAVTIAIMVSGLFEHNLGNSEILTMFLAVTALGYLAREKVIAGGVDPA